MAQRNFGRASGSEERARAPDAPRYKTPPKTIFVPDIFRAAGEYVMQFQDLKRSSR